MAMQEYHQAEPLFLPNSSHTGDKRLRLNDRFGSSLSSNRSLECKPFLVPRLWFAGSSVVFAVETMSPHDGASQEEPSKVWNARCGLGARRCNRLGGMVRPRPGRDASARLRAGA